MDYQTSRNWDFYSKNFFWIFVELFFQRKIMIFRWIVFELLHLFLILEQLIEIHWFWRKKIISDFDAVYKSSISLKKKEKSSDYQSRIDLAKKRKSHRTFKKVPVINWNWEKKCTLYSFKWTKKPFTDNLKHQNALLKCDFDPATLVAISAWWFCAQLGKLIVVRVSNCTINRFISVVKLKTWTEFDE